MFVLLGMFNINEIRRQLRVGVYKKAKEDNEAAEDVALILIVKLKNSVLQSSFHVQRTNGDGNCFFYSLSYALIPADQSYETLGSCFAKTLRIQFVQFLARVSEIRETTVSLSSICVPIEGGAGSDFVALKDSIVNDKSYMEYDLIALFSLFIGRNILVIKCNGYQECSNPFESYIMDLNWPFVIIQWDVLGCHVSVIYQLIRGREGEEGSDKKVFEFSISKIFNINDYFFLTILFI
jgi:hypothetical protein